MNDSKLLGCWGVIVGLVAVGVVGWMAVGLVLTLIGAGGPIAALADPTFEHELGELLVVGMALISVYVLVFRESTMRAFVGWARYPFWLGAALNLFAWLRAPDARWAIWALLFAVIGAGVPWLVSRR